MSDAARTALGREQREWLFEGLATSDARWQILANPSVMGQTRNPMLPEDVRAGLRNVKLIADDMEGPDFDQWDGYPAERDALLGHIVDRSIENLVVLSGDVHVSLALERRAAAFLPHWQWADLDSHGYVIVDVTRDRVTAEWWHLETVTSPSSGEGLGAAFSVRHGAHGLERLA